LWIGLNILGALCLGFGWRWFSNKRFRDNSPGQHT
jgi:hypothetical protein